MWDEQEPAKEVFKTLGRILGAFLVGLVVFFLVLCLDKNWIVAACVSLSVAVITGLVRRRS